MTTKASIKNIKKPSWLVVSLFAFCAIGTINMLHPFVGLMREAHEERCLDIKAAILKYWVPNRIKHNDLVIFKPFGPLSYVTDPFVMKQVAGIPGDHLVIEDEKVIVNGKTVVTGLPGAARYKKDKASFARDEIIPDGKFFVVGTHPLSNDSRYWGYLDASQIQGSAVKLF